MKSRYIAKIEKLYYTSAIDQSTARGGLDIMLENASSCIDVSCKFSCLQTFEIKFERKNTAPPTVQYREIEDTVHCTAPRRKTLDSPGIVVAAKESMIVNFIMRIENHKEAIRRSCHANSDVMAVTREPISMVIS